MTSLPYALRIILVLLVVMTLAEFAGRVVNWVLIVILLGLVLSQYGPTAQLMSQLGSTLRRK